MEAPGASWYDERAYDQHRWTLRASCSINSVMTPGKVPSSPQMLNISWSSHGRTDYWFWIGIYSGWVQRHPQSHRSIHPPETCHNNAAALLPLEYLLYYHVKSHPSITTRQNGSVTEILSWMCTDKNRSLAWCFSSLCEYFMLFIIYLLLNPRINPRGIGCLQLYLYYEVSSLPHLQPIIIWGILMLFHLSRNIGGPTSSGSRSTY